MLTEIAQAVESLKQISGIIRAANDISNFNEIATALADANSKLLEAQSLAIAAQESYATARKRIGELESEICELKNIKTTKERYKLHSFASGMLTYINKDGMEGAEPIHYLCAACYDNNQITKLQPAHIGRVIYYICHVGHPQIRG